ncbi:hypothetical protein HOLleu_26945 [Holothuria leucospilota]|uniref:Uncharacterized protein n=1 Tax=Holothuria leucospilota TaxID=206669 RepID=A0A9Q1BPZ9_HOLLE|nr:hypothetical protein HOLleu_26945 [Holothuria leucospilota]
MKRVCVPTCYAVVNGESGVRRGALEAPPLRLLVQSYVPYKVSVCLFFMPNLF